MTAPLYDALARVAAQTRTPLVDVRTLFEAHSPARITGPRDKHARSAKHAPGHAEELREVRCSGSEIRIHPSGRFLYAANRGHDTIAAFQIDAPSGGIFVK